MSDKPSSCGLEQMLHVQQLLDLRWPETKLEPSLARMSALMNLLGSPQLSYPSIHIAGTNGKTSVTRMADALLTSFGRRTGRTVSPHLQSAAERIAIGGKPIDSARYVETYCEIEPFVQRVDEQSAASGGPAMSMFEVVTAMAFVAFAHARVDVAVVEVGLGGRWDATNVVNAPVAVITPIGIDHAEYLGGDIPSIAAEKAGIITPRQRISSPGGTLAIIGQQCAEAMDVLMAHATHADAVVVREDSQFAVLDRRATAVGQVLVLQGLAGVYQDVFLPLHGEHQAHNAAIALAAVEAFLGEPRRLDLDTVRAGFAAVASPGRLERVGSAPTVLVDAAHNPAGAATLAQALRGDFDFRYVVGVVAVMADKDIPGIVAALEPVFDHIVVAHNGSRRGMDIDSLADIAVERFGPERVVRAATLAEAIQTATAMVEQAGAEHGYVSASVVITGSVVTAGVARTLFDAAAL